MGERLSWVGLILLRADPTGTIKRAISYKMYESCELQNEVGILFLFRIPSHCIGAQHSC